MSDPAGSRDDDNRLAYTKIGRIGIAICFVEWFLFTTRTDLAQRRISYSDLMRHRNGLRLSISRLLDRMRDWSRWCVAGLSETTASPRVTGHVASATSFVEGAATWARSRT